MIELNSFLNMDCMDGMKQFPDKYFELAIVDPPFGIGAAKMKRGNSKIQPDKNKTWDNAPPAKEYFNELFRTSKNQIIWGGNYFSLEPTRCFLIWDKGESMYERSFAECELAWTSFDESARMFKYNPNQLDRIHPTQKPIKLYEWLLGKYAHTGDKILDTHVGSASSLIACHNLHFDYVGFELDPDYYRDATARLESAKSQMKLL